ncbi:hypothetical protein C5Y96_00380 [Blastopirellula marina]|uniref:DUF11 domain-containing protein n=1 Tax=Blastopirellula marina TaxID=124 RepID=A0A2S8GBQ5_9BACT|nr:MULTISPECIES: DUF11 domain-containing protein [Pirellulaceae]PQO41863.1 hypothetical protein C5Y96_00380 [Blastopirellula marina]RCS56415.1 DUF11 domain-containing protein [Bremerella cremea]
MRWSTSTKRTLLLTTLWIAIVSSGCAPLRVPRIDPTGQRIFTHDTTPVECNLGCFNQQPAFRQPPPLSPCPASGVTPLTPLPAPPKGVVDTEALQLSPSRVVAPVGTEVVLVAGLNRKKHLHEAGRPVNWILSRESVGYITEVGKDSNMFDLVSNRDYGVQGPDFATSSTLLCDKTIDRGTELPGDDVRVLKGQTWMSISSAAPGVSRVTALAPTFENWPARQQTATIYWVDAQWQFPAAVVVPAGDKAVLSTTVLRQTNRQPVEGWKVQYEVLDGPASAFLVNGRPAEQGAPIETRSDSNGFATVELAPLTNQPGTAQVRVTIIQPNLDPESNAENLMLGSGVTTVTWSAPQLAVDMTGPQVAEFNAQAVYNINVQNGGDVAARNALVSVILPDGLKYESSVPAAQQYGNRLEWSIGDLEARGFRQISLTTRVQTSGTVENCVTVTAEPGLRSEDCTSTQISVDAIHLEMTGPEAVTVGDPVEYVVTIRNTGDRALTNMKLEDVFDNGLIYPNQQSPMYNDLGTLGIGQAKTIRLNFQTQVPGRFCHRLTVSADGVQGKSSTACVSVNPPPPEPTFTLELRAPASREVGQPILFRAVLTNTGATPLTNVVVEELIDPEFQITGRTDPARDEQNKVIWTFPRILPNQQAILEVQCQANRPVGQACNRISARTDEGVSQNAQTCTTVTPSSQPAAEPPPAVGQNGQPGAGGNQPVTGQLEVTMTELQDGIPAGQNVRYYLTIKNSRNVDDENVQIMLRLGEGMRFLRLNGPVNPQVSQSPDGLTVGVQPLQYLRAGESVSFQVDIQTATPGKKIVKAEVRSQRSPQGVSVQEDTTVY